jgi:hypothetical protein
MQHPIMGANALIQVPPDISPWCIFGFEKNIPQFPQATGKISEVGFQLFKKSIYVLELVLLFESYPFKGHAHKPVIDGLQGSRHTRPCVLQTKVQQDIIYGFQIMSWILENFVLPQHCDCHEWRSSLH